MWTTSLIASFGIKPGNISVTRKIKKIVISGSGRSGTAWVQDRIVGANDLRTILEPLYPVGVSEGGDYSFKYLDAAADDQDLRRFMDRVLTEQYRAYG